MQRKKFDHTLTSSSTTGSASFNKRSNSFSFIYDSETHLLLLIHKYKEDIFRGKYHQTWEKKCYKNLMSDVILNIVQKQDNKPSFSDVKKEFGEPVETR